jgi:hypothetical protein
LPPAWANDHLESFHAKTLQGANQVLVSLLGDLDPEDAGELAGEVTHATIEPVASVL